MVIKRLAQSEQGAILLIVLIVILMISILGAALMALFFNVLNISQIELDRTKALYLAEAGIAKAIGVLKNQASSSLKPSAENMAQTDMIVPPTKLNGDYFEVYNDYLQSTIISIGKSNGVKRIIQLRYNAF